TTSSAKKQHVRLPAANRYDYGFAQGPPTRTNYPSTKSGHYKINSSSLKDVFKALQSEVEPYIAPDQGLPEVDPKASLRLASLGVDLALQEKKTILWERDDESYSVRACCWFYIT
ncbi:hypothetical protein E4U11_008571, partial [Claviceps purpurea]